MLSAPSARVGVLVQRLRLQRAYVELASPSLPGGELFLRRLLFSGLEYGPLILGAKPLFESLGSPATGRRQCGDDQHGGNHDTRRDQNPSPNRYFLLLLSWLSR